jgi:hypothetical protein
MVRVVFGWLVVIFAIPIACTVVATPPLLGDFDGAVSPPPGGGTVPPPPAADGGDAGGLTVLAPADNPMAIALYGGSAYFTSYATGAGDGTVAAVSTGGGTVNTLATAQNGPWALTVVDGYVFFTLSPKAGTGGVASVPIAGGSIGSLQSNVNGAVGIATDGTNLYWTLDSSGVSIESVAISGGTPKDILDIGGDIHPQGLQLSGSAVYVPTTGTQAAVVSGVITSTGTAMGNLEPLDPPTSITFADVAISATTVYATVDDIAPNGQIIAYPRGTGSPQTVATGLNHPQRLALDGTNLYFTDPTGGNVWILDTTMSNPPVVFVSGLNAPLPIAVSDALYVGDNDAIVRIVKQ